jgi:tRNA threonylcarbamoyladenosine biosynthesis protein TsaE
MRCGDVPARKLRSSTYSWNLELSSPSDTEALGQAIGKAVVGGEVLALIGDLGAGKTAFVRGIAVGLDAPLDCVSSPTFVLIHEYRGRLPLIHVDLYRLCTESEAGNIGLEDYFTDRSVGAIEWADRFPRLLPPDRLEVRLMHKDPNTRTASATAHGPHSLTLLRKVQTAWQASHSRPSSRTRYRKISAS